MIVMHNKLINCESKSPLDCSDLILDALGHSVDFSLKTETSTDTVHGSVAILHNDPPELHQITVEVYETDEAPTATSIHGMMHGRQSTLKRPDPMPTEQVIKDRINAIRSN